MSIRVLPDSAVQVHPCKLKSNYFTLFDTTNPLDYDMVLWGWVRDRAYREFNILRCIFRTKTPRPRVK